MSGMLKPQQIVDQYKVENLTGRDGLREQYSAHEIETGRPIALVLLKQAYTEEGQFSQEYLQRTQYLTQIRHPNLIKYLSTGLVDGHPFLSMEPVSGFRLSERFERLSQEKASAHEIDALTLVQQMASGLALVERLDLFHHELTPEQILLRSLTLQGEDPVVITELDIPYQFALDEDQYSTYAANYLSPEQLAGKDIDGRSHVYSLGVILYELLCGELPSEPVTRRNTLWSTLRGRTPLQQCRPNLSPETYALVKRALHQNRRLRFPSVAAFNAALTDVLAEEAAPTQEALSEPAAKPRPVFLIPLLMFFFCGLLGSLTFWVVPGYRDGTESSIVSAAQATNEITDEAPGVSTTIQSYLTATATTAASMPKAGEDSRPTDEDSQKQAAASSTEEIATITPAAAATALPESAPSEQTATAEEPPLTLAAIVTPSPSSTPTSAPTAVPEPLFRVLASSANLRFGPGTNFDPIGYVYQADELEIIGRSTGDYIWLNVQTADGRLGWVAADVGELIGPGGLAGVQIAATLPPFPTARYTAVAAETPIEPSPLPSLAATNGSVNGSGNDGKGGNGGSGGNNQPRATPTAPF